MFLRSLLRNSAQGRDRHFWLLVSAVAAAAIFAAGLTIFEPFWETNDDNGMSEITHGYGMSASPSPALIYQNVIIGELLQFLPSLNGVLPYSWLMLTFLFFGFWALLYFTVRSGGGFWLALIALALVCARLLAAPQYTIIAGVATGAGVLAWLSHTKAPSTGCLVAGAVLISIGFLVRSREAAFVLGVALPFVPWRTLSIKRAEVVTAVAVVAFLGFAQFVDYQYYQAPEWASFQEMEPLRKAFTDYGADDYILAHPTRMEELGFTKNDITLIAQHFFVDPDMANPKRIALLLEAVPRRDMMLENAPLVAWALKTLYDPAVLPLMIAAIAMTFFSRRWMAAIASWSIFLVVIVMFALLGKPGALRIYYPTPILLLFVSIALALWTETRALVIRAVPYVILVGALVGRYGLIFTTTKIAGDGRA